MNLSEIFSLRRTSPRSHVSWRKLSLRDFKIFNFGNFFSFTATHTFLDTRPKIFTFARSAPCGFFKVSSSARWSALLRALIRTRIFDKRPTVHRLGGGGGSGEECSRASGREIAMLIRASWLIMHAHRPSQSPVYPISREQLPDRLKDIPTLRDAPCIASIQLILGLRHMSTGPRYVYVCMYIYLCVYMVPARDLWLAIRCIMHPRLSSRRRSDRSLGRRGRGGGEGKTQTGR